MKKVRLMVIILVILCCLTACNKETKDNVQERKENAIVLQQNLEFGNIFYEKHKVMLEKAANTGIFDELYAAGMTIHNYVYDSDTDMLITEAPLTEEINTSVCDKYITYDWVTKEFYIYVISETANAEKKYCTVYTVVTDNVQDIQISDICYVERYETYKPLYIEKEEALKESGEPVADGLIGDEYRISGQFISEGTIFTAATTAKNTEPQEIEESITETSIEENIVETTIETDSDINMAW